MGAFVQERALFDMSRLGFVAGAAGDDDAGEYEAGTDETAEAEMGKLTGGMKMPGMF